MRLRQVQSIFCRLQAKLIEFAYERGYELTFGDAYRDPRVHGKIGEKKSYSHASSAHKNRLAVDYNLFRDGKWLSETEDFRELGEFWESLHPLARWGGRFNDGNHFSFTWGGIS